MTRFWKFCLIAWLTALFCVPLVLFSLGVRNDVKLDNRPLANLPDLSSNWGEIGTYQKVSAFFSERFPGRASVIKRRTKALETYANDFASSRLVHGKDRWMFLKSGITYSCNQPRNLHVNAIVGLRSFSETLKKYGKPLLVTTAPNKSDIYPQKVADFYAESMACETKRYGWVVNKAKSPSEKRYNYSFFDTISQAQAYVRKNRVYRKPAGVFHWFDVHWDCRGSSILANSLLGALREKYDPSLTDVAKLSFFPAPRVSDISQVNGAPFEMTWSDCRTAIEGVKLKRVDNNKDPLFKKWSNEISDLKAYRRTSGMKDLSDLKVVMIHDSFSNGLPKFFPHKFKSFSMFNVNSRKYNVLAKEMAEADVVVMAIVQRSAYRTFIQLGKARLNKQLDALMAGS